MLPELRTQVPGPRSRELAAKLRRFESRNVTFVGDDWPVFWDRAEGTNVWDVDGNRFLDFTSAFGVSALGHGDGEIREALIEQAGSLIHAMGDVHPTALKADLCARLSALTFERWGAGQGKIILGNSGFEAVEAALKTSLLHKTCKLPCSTLEPRPPTPSFNVLVSTLQLHSIGGAMKKNLIHLVLSFSALLVFTSVALAQNTGTISGTV